MRPRPRIDWLNIAVWTGLALFALAVWLLALIGADTVLEWIR